MIYLDTEAQLHKCLVGLADRMLIQSAKDISDGGIASALAQLCFSNDIGLNVDLGKAGFAEPVVSFFEHSDGVLITCSPEKFEELRTFLEDESFFAIELGVTGGERIEINLNGQSLISATVSELKSTWINSLESQLAAEVVA